MIAKDLMVASEAEDVANTQSVSAQAVDSNEGKLEYARKKRREGKDLRRKADSTASAATRNSLFKRAEDILWESREAYIELIEAHDDGEGDYSYLQKEVEDVQTNIYHCQKTRTIVEYK